MGLTSVFVGLISLVNDALFAYIISEDGLNSNFHPVDVSTLNFAIYGDPNRRLK